MSNDLIYHPRAAMIADAYDLINCIHHKLIASTADLYIKIMRKRLREGLSERKQIIHAAMNENDELAHMVLMAEYDEWTEVYQLPPHSLVEYERWQREHGPPRKRGNKWWTDEQRNIGLSLVIALVGERWHLEPTRNPGTTDYDSACSIVRVAVKRRDRSLERSEVHLNRIWFKYGEAAEAAIAAWRAWPELLPHLPLGWLIRR